MQSTLPAPVVTTQVVILAASESSPTPAATAQILPRRTPAPGYAIARYGEVNLRSGPGVDYPVVGTVLSGNRFPVLGRSPNGEWLQVSYFYTDQGIAWVFIHLVILVEENEPEAIKPDWEVIASNPRRQGDRLFVDVCYELPDNRDWMIFDALLSYENDSRHIEEPQVGSTLLTIQEAGEGGNKGQRCDTLEFRLWAELEMSNPSLSVLSIGAYPREGMTCAWYLDEVQPRLIAQDAGIQIACEEVPHSFKLTITKWPGTINQVEAEGVVYQVFLDSITVKGPWIFPLEPSELILIPSTNASGSNPALEELHELQDLRMNNLLIPGWLHVITHETQRKADPSSSLDDRVDAWYELDEQMHLTRAVVRRLSPEGKEFQVQVLINETWHNLTIDESTAQDSTKAFELDFGFTTQAASAFTRGEKLTRYPLYFEGSYVGDQYVIDDGQTRREALFNPYSGMLRSFMTWRVIPGGTELVSSVSLETFETAEEPPPAIQVYLNP